MKKNILSFFWHFKQRLSRTFSTPNVLIKVKAGLLSVMFATNCSVTDTISAPQFHKNKPDNDTISHISMVDYSKKYGVDLDVIKNRYTDSVMYTIDQIKKNLHMYNTQFTTMTSDIQDIKGFYVVSFSIGRARPLIKNNDYYKYNINDLPAGIGITYDTQKEEIDVQILYRIAIKEDEEVYGSFGGGGINGSHPGIQQVRNIKEYVSFGPTKMRSDEYESTVNVGIGYPDGKNGFTNPIKTSFSFKADKNSMSRLKAKLIYKLKLPPDFKEYSNFVKPTFAVLKDTSYYSYDVMADLVGVAIFDSNLHLVHYEDLKGD